MSAWSGQQKMSLYKCKTAKKSQAREERLTAPCEKGSKNIFAKTQQVADTSEQESIREIFREKLAVGAKKESLLSLRLLSK